jgi:hypothetical protein
MPSFTIPQGVVVRAIWSLSGTDIAINVAGARNTGSVAITQTLTDTIGTAVKSGYTSSGLKALHPATVQLRKIGLRDVNTANLPEFLDAGAPATGTHATNTDLLPANVSYCVTIRTALAGKSYRGRWYQWGADEGQNDANGNPLNAYIVACVAFVNAVGTALSANGLTPAILSRVKNTAIPWSTAVNRNTTWSTQRRRTIPGV